MGRVKETLDRDKELQFAADVAVMEVKMEIMKIMLRQPTPEAQVAAIKDYLRGVDDDS